MKKLTTMFTMLVLTTGLVAGCKKKKDEEGKEPITAPATKTADSVKTPALPADKVDPPPTMATGDLPKECQDYKAAVDGAMKCDAMKATNSAYKTSLDTMSSSWTNLAGMAPEGRKALGDGCKAAAAGVNAALKAAGC
jgi:hypothetical protein